MPFANMGDLLNRKYAILGEHGDAALSSAIAQNRQAGVQESLAPSESSRNFAEGSAALTDASGRAGLESTQASQIPLDSAARRNLEASQASNYGADTALTRARTAGQLQDNSLLNLNLPGFAHGTANVPDRHVAPEELAALHQHLLAAKSGATKVPGKGDGTVDKVPAMLAPGEAVLNAGAAEHFGRHNIAALNAVGQAKMQAGKGAPAPTKAAPAKPQTFSGGTHMVGHGKSAKTPKIDPGVIQALMSMGPGGGAPPMGGGAPMMPPAPGMVPPGR